MIPSVVFAEEQKHLKPVPELSLSTPIIPKVAIVRKTNIVVYKQNRYTMPKGTYRPGRQVRIEPNETTNMVRFYDVADNSLIEEHRIETGIGKCIRHSHPERDRFTKNQQLLENALQGFGENELAKAFLEKVLETKPRYARDQLSVIVKLQQEYNFDELAKAVNYSAQYI